MSDNLIINGDFSAGIGATKTSNAGGPLTAVTISPGWEVTTHAAASSGDVDFATYSIAQAVHEGFVEEPPASIAGRGCLKITADGYANASGNFVRLDHFSAGAARALAGRYAEISFAIHAETRGIVRFSLPAVAYYDEGTASELEACPTTDVNLEPGWNFVRKQFTIPTFPVLTGDHYVVSDFLVFNIFVDLQGSKISLTQTDSVVIADVVLTEVTPAEAKFSPVAALSRSQNSIRRIVSYNTATPTAQPEDEYIMLTGVTTLTLPALTTVPMGKEICIKSLSGTPDIAADGTDTIDGAADVSLAAQFDFVRLVAGDTEWHVVGGNPT